VSFGGIAGLFLGFSLLSGVEIFYYFTMRALCMLYKNKEDLYAIEQKTLLRPPIKYDLSLKPKFGQRHPVEAAPAVAPILQIISEHSVISDGQIERMKRIEKFHTSNHVLTVSVHEHIDKE
jgi:hypothetical protein